MNKSDKNHQNRLYAAWPETFHDPKIPSGNNTYFMPDVLMYLSCSLRGILITT